MKTSASITKMTVRIRKRPESVLGHAIPCLPGRYGNRLHEKPTIRFTSGLSNSFGEK